MSRKKALQPSGPSPSLVFLSHTVILLRRLSQRNPAMAEVFKAAAKTIAAEAMSRYKTPKEAGGDNSALLNAVGLAYVAALAPELLQH